MQIVAITCNERKMFGSHAIEVSNSIAVEGLVSNGLGFIFIRRSFEGLQSVFLFGEETLQKAPSSEFTHIYPLSDYEQYSFDLEQIQPGRVQIRVDLDFRPFGENPDVHRVVEKHVYLFNPHCPEFNANIGTSDELKVHTGNDLHFEISPTDCSNAVTYKTKWSIQSNSYLFSTNKIINELSQPTEIQNCNLDCKVTFNEAGHWIITTKTEALNYENSKLAEATSQILVEVINVPKIEILSNKYFEISHSSSRLNLKNDVQHAEGDMAWICLKKDHSDKMPKTADEMSNLLKDRKFRSGNMGCGKLSFTHSQELVIIPSTLRAGVEYVVRFYVYTPFKIIGYDEIHFLVIDKTKPARIDCKLNCDQKIHYDRPIVLEAVGEGISFSWYGEFCKDSDCDFDKTELLKVKFHSNPYYNIIPKELDGSGDFSVSLAMKFEGSNAISYAQYFAIIPEKPTVGICMNGPAGNADFTSITCEDWKDGFNVCCSKAPSRGSSGSSGLSNGNQYAEIIKVRFATGISNLSRRKSHQNFTQSRIQSLCTQFPSPPVYQPSV